jgi:beta-lactamase superfamily II metal-dependent hydrolase
VINQNEEFHVDCEIEFMPVGDSSKAGDAIVVRYGDASRFELMIVDGGNLDSGKALVAHVRKHYGNTAIISHVVLTHCDADHASGLREVLTELPVTNFWLHVPWLAAAAARPYFANKNWTDDGLRQALRKEYDLVDELVTIAINRKTAIYQPFAGGYVGPFRVLSPDQNVYPLLLPQFDRTPDPDQAAIEATGWWIGKQPGLLARFFEKAAAKVQKWVPESRDVELLKDGGITSASNESSVILYGDFGIGRRALLTGDAGVRGLSCAAYCAEMLGLPLRDFMFVQIPHHGSRRNVGPTVLNRLIGPIQSNGAEPRFSAFVSAPKDDDTHPRKMVLNAFTRRGGKVLATQGVSKVYWGGFPTRPGYEPASPLPFATQVEAYD